MSYVTHVFMTYFNYPKSKAEQLMLQVHHEGRAFVSHGDREKIERDVAAMHEFGLWATVEQGGLWRTHLSEASPAKLSVG